MQTILFVQFIFYFLQKNAKILYKYYKISKQKKKKKTIIRIQMIYVKVQKKKIK